MYENWGERSRSDVVNQKNLFSGPGQVSFVAMPRGEHSRNCETAPVMALADHGGNTSLTYIIQVATCLLLLEPTADRKLSVHTTGMTSLCSAPDH